MNLKTKIFAFLFFAIIFLSLLIYILLNKSFDEWSENEYARVFVLKFSPIFIQPFFLRTYLNEEITWISRILKDIIQTVLPPLVALVTFSISLTEKSPSEFNVELLTFKIPIIIFFSINLISGCRMLYLSVIDFMDNYGRSISESAFPQHINFINIFNLISGGLLLIPLYAEIKPFIIYCLSYTIIFVLVVYSALSDSTVKNSLRYLMRTLLIGIISYFVTTDYMLMNNISITTLVFAASITLSYVISEHHRLDESYIFKLDRYRNNLSQLFDENEQLKYDNQNLRQKQQNQGWIRRVLGKLW